MDFKSSIENCINESINVKKQLLNHVDLIDKAANKLIDAYRNGNKVLIFGNGGSAADAQHIAAELVGKFYMERRPLPAQALTVNTSSLTAIGNDYSYEDVFSRQINAFGKIGDVAIGITTSGNSKNVINAMIEAKKLGIYTIGLTGIGGGKLKDHVDICIAVPSSDTPRIQECHILIGHIICQFVEKGLFDEV